MKKRGRGALLALLAAMTLVAAGCGDDDDGGGTTGTTAAQPLQLADLSGQTVEVAAIWSGEEQEKFQKVLDDFEQRTKATVRYSPTGDDVGAYLGTKIAGNQAPDVALLPNPGLMNDLAGKGNLQPIDDVVGAQVDANFGPSWRTLGTSEGKLYGVFFKAANKSTVWYNKHVLENAGVQPPADWETFKQSIDTISGSGTTPLSVAGADWWTLTDWFENVYIRTAGADKYDQLTKHEIPWTDESVKTAMTTLGEVLGQPNNIAGGTRGALSTDFPGSVSTVFSDPPKAGIVYEADFVAGVITGETQAKLGTDADFFNFPAISGSQSSAVVAGDAAVLLKDTPGGKELIKYLASPEAATIWVKLGGFTSANKQVDLAAYPDDIARRSAQAVTTSANARFDMSDLTPAAFGGTPGKALAKGMQDLLRGEFKNIDQVLAQLEKDATAAYGSS
jgi:ABC-type Fe3+ transport system substrate-binding protein